MNSVRRLNAKGVEVLRMLATVGLSSALTMLVACSGPRPVTAEVAEPPTLALQGPELLVVTVAELRGGIQVPVDVLVPNSPVPIRALPLDGAACHRPDANGLALFPVVERMDPDPGRVYCPACDLGYCARGERPDTRVRAGKHSYRFVWHGQSGNGPSHYATSSLEAPTVQPGLYKLTISAAFANDTRPSPDNKGQGLPNTTRFTSLTIKVTP